MIFKVDTPLLGQECDSVLAIFKIHFLHYYYPLVGNNLNWRKLFVLISWKCGTLRKASSIAGTWVYAQLQVKNYSEYFETLRHRINIL